MANKDKKTVRKPTVVSRALHEQMIAENNRRIQHLEESVKHLKAKVKPVAEAQPTVLQKVETTGADIGKKETGWFNYAKAHPWIFWALAVGILLLIVWAKQSHINNEPQRINNAVKSYQDTIRFKNDTIQDLRGKLSFRENKRQVDSSAAALFGQSQITSDDVKKKFGPKVILWTA